MKVVMPNSAARMAIEVTEELNDSIIELNRLVKKKLAGARIEVNASDATQEKKADTAKDNLDV